MKVTLKDGSFKEYAQPMAVIDIAKDISEGLARMACVAEIDGEVKDLRTIVDKDCTLNIFTAKDPEGLAALRHTASHVMAQAIKRIWPETKLAIGPSIADGFYYDIDRDEPVTSDDLAKIEAEMKKIICGTNEFIIGSVHEIPDFLDLSCDAINELLRSYACVRSL